MHVLRNSLLASCASQKVAMICIGSCKYTSGKSSGIILDTIIILAISQRLVAFMPTSPLTTTVAQV